MPASHTGDDNSSENNSDGRFFSTRIDLPPIAQVEAIEILNRTLALTLELKTQVKYAHWNVKGMHFYQLHQLYDGIATQLEAYIALITERIAALGGEAMGTTRIAAQKSEIPEYPLNLSNGKDHVTALVAQIATYARAIRAGIDCGIGLGEADTADLYTEISRTIDKYLWFQEAHL